jgi:hypothetical protein
MLYLHSSLWKKVLFSQLPCQVQGHVKFCIYTALEFVKYAKSLQRPTFI